MPDIHLPDPGFVPNAPDRMSCLLACMQMVMKTKPGGVVLSFDEMNKILRRKEGLYSWDYALTETVSRMGFEVQTFSTFSTKRFLAEKEAYLIDYYGEEAGRVQIENSDLPVVLEDAQRFLDASEIVIHEGICTKADICRLLNEGWYILPVINSKLLKGEDGYEAHSIFVYGFDDETILFHDPGPAPVPERRVSWDIFDAVWSSPTIEARQMLCFKPDLSTAAS